MAHKNGFSISVKSNSHPTAFHRDNYWFVALKNRSKYSVVLTNDNPTRCDVELFIDKEKMGKWRINPHSSITIERPSGVNKQFMFVEEDGSEAWAGRVTPGAHKNGLITAKFYPELDMDYILNNKVDEVIDNDSFPKFNSAAPNIKGFAFNAPTQTRLNNCYGAQCIRSSLGSRGSVMNESINGIAPLSNSMIDGYVPPHLSYGNTNNFKSGATVLNGTSRQNFGKVSAIKNVDELHITHLNIRLVVEEDTTIYPLHSRCSRNPEPPRIDRVDPLDKFFPQYEPIHRPYYYRDYDYWN